MSMTVSKQKLPDISSVVITAADVSYTLQCNVIQSLINFIWSTGCTQKHRVQGVLIITVQFKNIVKNVIEINK